MKKNNVAAPPPATPIDVLTIVLRRSRGKTVGAMLESTKARCVDRLDSALVQRMEQILLHLHAVNTNRHQVPYEKDVVMKWANLLQRIRLYLLSYLDKRKSIMLTRMRQIMVHLLRFHEEMDQMLHHCQTRENEPAIITQDWKEQWKQDRQMQFQRYNEFLGDRSNVERELMDDDACVEVLTLLHFEFEHYTHKFSSFELQVMHSLFDLVKSKLQVDVFPRGITSLPLWFIPSHEVLHWSKHFGSGSFGKVHFGSWLDAKVVVECVDASVPQDFFLNYAAKWHQLSHPHVLHMYGACHVGNRMFVCEYASNGALSQFLIKKKLHHGLLIWKCLYEAALGLQYLHEREIAHGKLNCSQILIGKEDKVLLIGFGLSSLRLKTSTNDWRWMAPELLLEENLLVNPTLPADVFAFSSCILEAVTHKMPWQDMDEDDASIRGKIHNGELPPRPSAVTDEQWLLITQMRAVDPSDRVKISFVVHQLAKFAQQEKQENRGKPSGLLGYSSRYSMNSLATTTDSSRSLMSIATEENDVCLAEFVVPSGDTTIKDVLDRIRCHCEELQDDAQIHMYVYERLNDIFHHIQMIKVHEMDPKIVTAYSKLLTQFQHSVERYARLKKNPFMVTSHQRPKSNFTLHKQIDQILDRLNLADIDNSIHNWKQHWSQCCDKDDNLPSHLGEENTATSDNSNVDSESVSQTQSSVSSIQSGPVKVDLIAELQAMTTDVSEWFIPPYEVEFDQMDSFSNGSYGSVHHGKWLDTSVVIKSVFTNQDNWHEIFLREVKIWYRLNHPHVIKLYGACHIGQPFFVCEYAANGTLDEFTSNSSKKQNQDCYFSSVWQKLHEAALGLQYLHERSIVHGDLKCNNILIGMSWKAKLTDFGLSSIVKPKDAKPNRNNGAAVGAQRWKAPECLLGEKPTFASDIYSFGMCILEAVSGEIPWGQMPDAAVRYHVKRGKLPMKPKHFRPKEWELVCKMCATNPNERISIATAVQRLGVFAGQDCNVFFPSSTKKVKQSKSFKGKGKRGKKVPRERLVAIC